MKEQPRVSLASFVTETMQEYFHHMDGDLPCNLQQFFMDEIEKPFLQVVLEAVDGNQSEAARILGVNRGTFRKKLKSYGLI